MKESVTAVLTFLDQVYVIKRKDSLPAFPGYLSFPGGKIDKADKVPSRLLNFNQFPADHINALIREVKEELGYDLHAHQDLIEAIDYVGEAISPDFNPVRFKNFYYLIQLRQMPVSFNLCQHEIAWGKWVKKSQLMNELSGGKEMTVPPTRKVIQLLGKNHIFKEETDFSLGYDSKIHVPWIEVVDGIIQFMPLSHTLPPAQRTNCFLLGDEKKILVDPSPCDKNEYDKLVETLKGFSFDSILITHHHGDHNQFANELALHFNKPILISAKAKKMIEQTQDLNFFQNLQVKIIKEGDEIGTYHGDKIHVYETPGHDMGQVGLAPSQMSWFLVGDLIQGIGTVVISAPEGDMADYFHSLQRIIDMRPHIIMPSHGIPLGGTFKLEQTLTHRKMREQQIINHLPKVSTLDELVTVIYTDLPAKLIPYARATVRSHLVKIEREKLAQVPKHLI